MRLNWEDFIGLFRSVTVGDLDEINTELQNKSDKGHLHSQGDIGGLDISLGNKADITYVNNLLDGKADLDGVRLRDDQVPVSVVREILRNVAGGFLGIGSNGRFDPAYAPDSIIRESDAGTKFVPLENGKINPVYIDSLSTSEMYEVSTIAERDQLVIDGVVQIRDIVVVQSTVEIWAMGTDGWIKLNVGGVVSVAGKTGVVVLAIPDIAGLSSTLSTKADLVDGIVPSEQLPGGMIRVILEGPFTTNVSYQFPNTGRDWSVVVIFEYGTVETFELRDDQGSLIQAIQTSVDEKASLNETVPGDGFTLMNTTGALVPEFIMVESRNP